MWNLWRRAEAFRRKSFANPHDPLRLSRCFRNLLLVTCAQFILNFLETNCERYKGFYV